MNANEGQFTRKDALPFIENLQAERVANRERLRLLKLQCQSGQHQPLQPTASPQVRMCPVCKKLFFQD